ncbi:MAG: multiprotein bridging factor aMBF1 [Methanosphaera sp.]|nr:multiprotein bridging factor aMBF1 [Methanosphaera sp.]
MNCEICGSEIKGEPFETKIDNSVMITCKECSNYGVVQKKPQARKSKNKSGNNKNQRRSQNNSNNNNKNRRPRRNREDEYELCDDYTTLIRQAREKRNLTQKKLGELIYERESVIAHIESGKMIPDTNIAQKIERILKIKIIEKTEVDEREFQDVRRFKEATLGDIANIKIKK